MGRGRKRGSIRLVGLWGVALVASAATRLISAAEGIDTLGGSASRSSDPRRRVTAPRAPLSRGPRLLKKPAATYSPGPLRAKYHRR